MTRFWRKSLAFLREDDGPTATEYAVLLAVICITAMTAMGAFGDHMDALYTTIDGDVLGVM